MTRHQTRHQTHDHRPPPPQRVRLRMRRDLCVIDNCATCDRIELLRAYQIGTHIANIAHLCSDCVTRLRGRMIAVTLITD